MVWIGMDFHTQNCKYKVKTETGVSIYTDILPDGGGDIVDEVAVPVWDIIVIVNLGVVVGVVYVCPKIFEKIQL